MIILSRLFRLRGGSCIADETYGIDEDRLKIEEEAEAHDRAENISLGVHHGDSDTVLFIEHAEETDRDHPKDAGKTAHYPFALLWGKEEFFEEGESLS